MTNNEAAHELMLQILKTRMNFRQTIQRVLKSNSIDMTFEMLQVMHRLWKEPGVSQQYLALQTAKDKSCLTYLINNLEKKGWVERQEDPSDRRNRLIHLTPEGEALSLRVRPLLNEIYHQVGIGMTPKQIESFMKLLNKLDDILDKI